VRTISVKDGETLIKNINELEFIGENIYANIFMTETIAIINPLTGEVTGWIDLTGIYQHNRHNDVLNGIAYDDETDRLFVTGKCWPYLYEITIKAKK
ncbi:MAG: glutaminyl-peptide cyclotransferase, partial [Crenarchaeota archaeon]|nr:glutaminyl-peptide cyclotransferase [Thermoproteota archaeon]